MDVGLFQRLARTGPATPGVRWLDMALVPSIVSNIPTVTPGTSGQLASAVAAEAAPQGRTQAAVELASSLRANMEGLVQSTEVAGRLVDPGPAAVGRFAATKRTTNPTQRGTGGGEQAEARDKDSLLELFAGARLDAGQGVGRLSGGLSRAGRRGQQSVGRFQPQILPRPRRSGIEAAPSSMREAFAGGIGRFQPSVGRLSGALTR